MMALTRTKKILNGIYLPDHLVMSAQECIQLYDALECVLGREKSSSLEPSVILGERFLKKKDVLEYVETLKKFVCNLILEGKAGLEMFERLKTELTSTDCHFDDGLLHNEERFLKSNNDKLLSYMMKENMFPAIVFVFNRSYCPRLSSASVEFFENKIEETKDSPTFKQFQAKEEKKQYAQRKLAKKLQAKVDKNAKENKKSNVEDNSELLELGDQPGEIQSAWQMLNSIRKKFPNCSLVGKNNMGEEEANFIFDQLKRAPDLQIDFFIKSLKYGISWHHAGNSAKMRQATEMMFRQKFVQMVYATTTLAQAQYIYIRTVSF